MLSVRLPMLQRPDFKPQSSHYPEGAVFTEWQFTGQALCKCPPPKLLLVNTRYPTQLAEVQATSGCKHACEEEVVCVAL